MTSTSKSSITTPSLSLVIPAYNEERRLPASIRDIRAFFQNFSEGLEVIIVIEKSSDKTLELANQAAAGADFIKIVANSVQRGKGYAVRTGMLLAKGEIVFFMDADLSTPLAEILRFLQMFAAEPGIDILIGSRADAKSLILRKQSWFRRNLGRGFNHFVQFFGVKGVKDTQCGFKAFRKVAVIPIFARQSLNGFAFDVEVLVLAEKMGFKIQSIPVRWLNSTDSKVRIWIDPLLMLWDLVRIRWIVHQNLKAQPLAPKALPFSE